MEFLEEESRPRFLFQSRLSSSSSVPKSETLKPTKPHLLFCFLVAIVLLFLSFSLFSEFQTLNFLLIWISLSLLLAPFAPSSSTGGDPRVGLGEPLPPPDPISDSEPDRAPPRRTRTRRPDNPLPLPKIIGSVERNQDPIRNTNAPATKEEKVEESEWTDEDFEILKKQISKHPAGEPRRWEKIAESFQGRHGVESVITTSKSLSERRPEAKDSFAQFLKQRKPVDKRIEEAEAEAERENENVGWSSGEDIALLNALKAFPKEASMRWEKISAAVPGRSKAECMKRVAELKRDFRSSKTSE